MRFEIATITAFVAAVLAAPGTTVASPAAEGTSPNLPPAAMIGQCHLDPQYVYVSPGMRLSDKYLWLKTDSCAQGFWDLKGFQVENLKADLKAKFQNAGLHDTHFSGCVYHGWRVLGGVWAAEMILHLEAGWDKSWLSNTDLDLIAERFWNYRAENGKFANLWTEIWSNGNSVTRVGWIQFYGRLVGALPVPDNCRWVD